MTGPRDSLQHGDRFRVLFEHSLDAQFIFDENGITDCNDVTVKLLKASDKAHLLSLHPRTLPRVSAKGPRSLEKAKEMDALAQARGFHRFEWMHRKLDGEVFPVGVTLTPLRSVAKPAMIAV